MPLDGKSWLGSLGRDIVILGQHPVFVLNLIAYCPIQGAFGAYTFWGPKVSIEHLFKHSTAASFDAMRGG